MRVLELSIIFRPRVDGLTAPRLLLSYAALAIHGIAPWHEKLKEWFLKGDTVDDAYLYPVLDATGAPSTAANAVLAAKFKGDNFPGKVLGIWNGETGAHGAHATYLHKGAGDATDLFTLNIKKALIPALAMTVVAAVRDLAVAFDARALSAASSNYDPVFKDRPGVGWMLYLPRVLTVQQVPEARALVPVFDADKNRRGTIIVSVTDEPFSDENPEHVKIANAIEIRLIDQDLLPRYADL